MSMQTDVKSAHTAGAQTNQALISGRARIKSVVITGGAGAGIARFLDASGGNILIELDTGSNSNMTNVIIPGEGVLFPNGVWYTSVAVVPTGITVFYG
tara:strand:+ start:392 stop:685 length:294 start_codon:yes stop_codon:yes gene_type:complete